MQQQYLMKISTENINPMPTFFHKTRAQYTSPIAYKYI